MRVFVDHRRWDEVKEAFPGEVDTRINEEKLKKEQEKKNNQMIRRVIKVKLFTILHFPKGESPFLKDTGVERNDEIKVNFT